jgi:hypothetical protein
MNTLSVEVSKELLKIFEEEAKNIVKQIVASEEETEWAVKGAMAAMIATYKRNNGMPTIDRKSVV